ncbi:G -coupled receptor kinase 5 [Brachionus plicatilis]|uniref:G-coupled receptor kinase 5 n=1 Tax=Brachionus plicatilis TaxID=10195 RepID=A0A3M7RJ67_BRAPC|nr:G -coupled receptor kinase 5 [Brachionus plicatilis]
MELENIVANTVYIKARAGEGSKNKGRSKKWKQMLKLAPISECIYLKNEIGKPFFFNFFQIISIEFSLHFFKKNIIKKFIHR